MLDAYDEVDPKLQTVSHFLTVIVLGAYYMMGERTTHKSLDGFTSHSNSWAARCDARADHAH